MQPNPQTLAAIVAHYRSSADQRARDDVWWRCEDRPFAEVCKRAAASLRHDGNLHDHQKRPGRSACEDFAAAVTKLSQEIGTIRSFDLLLQRIELAGMDVVGTGELLTYDTADRIALRLGLEPEVVYMHAGTRVGARRLLPWVRKSTRSISVADLPGALAELTPREAEDVLCIYAELFFETPHDFQSWTIDRDWCGRRRRRRRRC